MWVLVVWWTVFQISPLELAIRKFNQVLTAGVGVGLISNRPRRCEPMTGFWATNQFVLYRCTGGKGQPWEPYYTPFRYPVTP